MNMDNTFKTSFIPKKPITSSVKRTERSLFSIISIFLIIVAIILSGLLFVYKTYLTKQKETLSASLLQVRDTFEKDTIEELEMFNKRTDIAKQILGGHVVLSPLFSLLSEITIPSVQYTKFDQETNEKGFLVKMSGIAKDYRSIALQADMFNTVKGRSLKNVVFSDLTKDKNGNILFDLQFYVDPSLLSYEKNSLIEKAAPVLEANKTETQLPETEVLPEDLSSQSTQ